MFKKSQSHQWVEHDKGQLYEQVFQCRKPEGCKAHYGVVGTDIVCICVDEYLFVDANGNHHVVKALHQVEQDDGAELPGGEHVLAELKRLINLGIGCCVGKSLLDISP